MPQFKNLNPQHYLARLLLFAINGKAAIVTHFTQQLLLVLYSNFPYIEQNTGMNVYLHGQKRTKNVCLNNFSSIQPMQTNFYCTHFLQNNESG